MASKGLIKKEGRLRERMTCDMEKKWGQGGGGEREICFVPVSICSHHGFCPEWTQECKNHFVRCAEAWQEERMAHRGKKRLPLPTWVPWRMYYLTRRTNCWPTSGTHLSWGLPSPLNSPTLLSSCILRTTHSAYRPVTSCWTRHGRRLTQATGKMWTSTGVIHTACCLWWRL